MPQIESSFSVPGDARCVTCHYPLVGLPEPRCPECGRGFDPSDLQSFLNGARRSALVVLAIELWRRHRWRLIPAGIWSGAVGLSWLLFEWGEGAFSFLFWIPAAFLVFRRRWVGAAVAVLLSPAVVLLLMQCREYSHGGLHYVRGSFATIQTPQGSLKRDTRVRGFDPGCGTRASNYWLRYWAERKAVPIMHFIMGPPPGAYKGPYPTLQESLKALEGGTVQAKSVVENGRIAVGGKNFKLDGDQLAWWGFVVTRPDPAPVTAALFKSQCVIVRVPRDLSPRLAAVYLFDSVTGQCFAVYWDEDGVKG